MIENAYLENKEQIILGDFNIDFLNTDFYKHYLVKSLMNLNLTQTVNEITRPASNTCLDHIYTNYPARMFKVFTKNIGLSDHLPVFAVRRYKKSDMHGSTSNKQHIHLNTET